MVVLFWELMLEVCCWGIRKEKLKWTIQQWIWNPNYRSYLTWDHFILASIHSTNHNALLVCRNVLKSATLLSATPEIGSEGGVPLLFLSKEGMWEWHSYFWGERKYERPSFFTLFFLQFSFFWHSFSVNKLVSQSILCCLVYIFLEAKVLSIYLIESWHKISFKFLNSSTCKEKKT